MVCDEKNDRTSDVVQNKNIKPIYTQPRNGALFAPQKALRCFLKLFSGYTPSVLFFFKWYVRNELQKCPKL